MENLWYFWLLATRNHMRRTRKKDTKAIFISSTELLRNTLISFLAETDKNIRWGSLSTDQLLQLTIQYCYVLNFYMFYAKFLCENRPSIRDKSRAKNKFKVVAQFKQIPFKYSDCYMLSGIKLASILFILPIKPMIFQFWNQKQALCRILTVKHIF